MSTQQLQLKTMRQLTNVSNQFRWNGHDMRLLLCLGIRRQQQVTRAILTIWLPTSTSFIAKLSEEDTRGVEIHKHLSVTDGIW